MGSICRGTRTFRQINLALFAAGFVTFITLYDVQPLLPVFSHEFRVPAALGSLPLSVSTCAMAITILLAGTVSETWGRKRIMTISLFLTAGLAIMTAFSHTFFSLLVLRLLEGVVLAGLQPVAMAYLSEEIDPSSVGTAMGLYIGGNAVGGMTGRIFTASIADFFSWRAAVGMIGALCLLLSIYFARRLPPSVNFRQRPFAVRYLYTSLLQQLQERGLLCLYGISFLIMGSFVTLYNYITFRLLNPPYNMSQMLISWIFLVYLLGSCSSTLMGHLTHRFGRDKMLLLSLAAMFLGTAITLVAPVAVIIGGIAVFTCGFFGAHSIASSWVGTRARSAKAQASSLYLFFYYLGSSISGTLGGFFWARYGWGGVAGLIGLLLAFGFIFAIRLASLPEPVEAVAHPH